MSIIKTHDITLYGGDGVDIVLRPLRDEHLPLLYKWNADPEVVYWTDSVIAESLLLRCFLYKSAPLHFEKR